MPQGKIIKAGKAQSPAQKLAFKSDGLSESVPLTRQQFGEAFAKFSYDAGVRTLSDLEALVRGEDLPSAVKDSVVSMGGSVNNGKIKFAETGGVQVGNFSTFYEKLIRKVGSTEDPGWELTEFFPDATYESNRVVVEIQDALKGTLKQRPLQTNLPQVARLGYEDYEFAPISYAAEKIFSEEDIFLRNLGDANLAKNGLMQRIGYDMYDLQVRMFVTKKLLLSKAVFDGELKYQGRTISYGIPAENSLVRPNPEAWGIASTTTPGEYAINDKATPLTDMQTLLNQSEVLRKYLNLPMKIFLNNATHQLFFSNPNNLNTMQFALGNPDFLNQGQPYNMQSAIKYFMGSQNNVEVVVIDDQYFPEEDDEFGNAAQADKPTFIFPTGKILFAIDVSQYNGPLGEFAFTIAPQNGGIYNPQPGPWSVLEDCSTAGSVGGITNPFLRAGCGFNGMPKLDRPFDIVTLDVL